MAAIEELVRSIADPRIRDALALEVARLKAGKKFGLVFEEHLPETVLLPGLAIKVGARVMLKNDPHSLAFRVIEEVNGKKVKVIPDHVTKSGVIRGLPESIVNAAVVMNRADLVVAKAFGEPMYPALIPVDSVERAPGKPWHVLINADNYHALQLLQYGYTGKVDVIYIDPPYNTGARDWKYNNDYVDRADRFHHSKWLSMMKKRLRLASGLLKPTGVMVVAIDDCEAHHLRCLIEEIHDQEAFLGTVVVRSKPSGSQTEKGLAVSHEYAYFVGGSSLAGVQTLARTEDQRARFTEEDETGPFWWENLRRAGSNSRKEDRPKLFYPLWVTRAGEVEVPKLTWDESARKYRVLSRMPAGATEVLPIREDGTERNWSWSHTKVQESLSDIKAVKDGLQYGVFRKRRMRREGVLPQTIWYDKRYSASEHGTNMLRTLLGDSDRFSYPKSLYTVMDCIRCATENSEAVILDFFGGSGTTLHSVAALNAEDGGTRRCILVTNNEVGEKAASALRAAGVEEGSAKWEREGIAASVTWPRTVACISGKHPDGSKLAGDYLDGRPFADGYEENAAYFKLDFLDPDEVSRGEQFGAVIPILWMLAGSVGACSSSKGTGKWYIPSGNRFAVLLKEDCFGGFRDELAKRDDVTHVFLVTDSAEAFNDMAAVLGSPYTCLQLYRSYIDTFRINLGEPGTRGASDYEPVPAFDEEGA